MIYTPRKHPKQAMILVSLIAGAGIFGGYFLHAIFSVIALIFWIQYTAVLSYMQFKKKRDYSHMSITQTLIDPQVRFFLFEFLAVIGLFSYFKFGTQILAYAVLFVWWLFSLNFYLYYEKKKK